MNQEYYMKGQETGEHHCHKKCLSWTAIIAGALVGVGLSLLLNLFGVAIGLTAYTTTSEGVTALAVSGFIGMAIGIMIVMFISGWVSGFLARPNCTNYNLGVLYGFITWSLAIVLGVILTSNVGQFMTMQYDAVTNPKSIVYKISSYSAPAVTTQSASPAAANVNTAHAVMKDEEAVKALGKSLLLVFLLLLVGAITSSFGGYVGMSAMYRRKSNINR